MPSSFEFLFKAYFPRLFGYALRFVPDEEDARDLVQDCFVALWEKKENITSDSIVSMLFTMVRNSCLNYLKHQSVVRKHQLTCLEKNAGEEYLYHADMLMHTESKLLLDELQEQVNWVIDSLPPRCREVFLMSRNEGLKNREIAEKLMISTTAVEKHIAKAIHLFQQHFKNRYPVDLSVFVLLWLLEI
jgi:RNA polymerase sigma-70 factor (family 1)